MAKTQTQTPSFISSLLRPMPGKGADRRAWSIPLAGVWLPFFTATNTAGETNLAPEVLGSPLRLQKDKDGTPKFGSNGRPVIRVVKELSEQIRIVRENFTAGLLSYADSVRKNLAAEYKAQVEAAHKAGSEITTKDAAALDAYLAAIKEAEAAVKKAPTEAPVEARELVAA